MTSADFGRIGNVLEHASDTIAELRTALAVKQRELDRVRTTLDFYRKKARDSMYAELTSVTDINDALSGKDVLRSVSK